MFPLFSQRLLEIPSSFWGTLSVDICRGFRICSLDCCLWLKFIHVKNLQLLMTEIYKTRPGWSPPFMKDIFAERNTGYNLRHGNDTQFPKVHTTTYGIETTSFLVHKLWSTLPNTIKQASTLSVFKSHIKCWRGENRNCKIYIQQVGYLTWYVSIFFYTFNIL